jgi:CHAD domain-containing protein
MASISTQPEHLTGDVLARPARFAARLVARERLRQVIRAAPTQAVPAGEDTLHDFRVALRRLRTWLRAFDPQLEDTVGRGTLHRFRRLSRQTGAARDLEVQLTWLAHPTVRLGPMALEAASALASRLQLEHAAALAKALEELSDELPRAGAKLDSQLRRYQVKVRLGTAREDSSMAVTVGLLLREGTALVRQTTLQVASPDQAAEAHQARLAVKHLRYLLESLGTVQRGGPRAAERLATLQDALGVLHDRHVLLDRVAREILEQGSRRALVALQTALGRGAASEFKRAIRVAQGRAFRTALRAVDRVSSSLLGEPPTHPLPDLAATDEPPASPPPRPDGSGAIGWVRARPPRTRSRPDSAPMPT